MSQIGIGRRRFIAAFGAMLATVPSGLSRSVLFNETNYVNRALGFGVRIPEGWHVLSAAEMGCVDALAAVNPEVRASLDPYIDSNDRPFVALTKERSSTSSIQVYLASNPTEIDPGNKLIEEVFQDYFPKLPQPEFSPPMTKIRQDWQAARWMMKRFRVSKLPSETTVSNCPSAEYTASFDCTASTGNEEIRLRLRTIAIVHHQFTFLLRLIDSLEAPEDFHDFINSVALV